MNSANYQLLLSAMNVLYKLCIAVMLVVYALGLVVTTLLVRNMIRPLTALSNTAHEVAKGNLNVPQLPVVVEDEVGIVTRSFNQMLESIRQSIDQLKDSMERQAQMKERELLMETHLKEAQLKYLQAQINPHFLFNSLNAAAQLAMMEGAENTCLFVQNMADFFRYNVRKMEKDTTLKEELELVDNYIYILNVRFAGEIHYTKQIDERVTGTMMPSMILQPLIENAVNHGIRELQGEGKIHLSVYSDDGMVCVKVEDNGVGIEPEVIEKIMRGESAHSHSQRDSAGIGMDNVINRLKRYYNMEHVIEIRRREERGTEVLIYLKREDIR